MTKRCMPTRIILSPYDVLSNSSQRTSSRDSGSLIRFGPAAVGRLDFRREVRLRTSTYPERVDRLTKARILTASGAETDERRTTDAVAIGADAQRAPPEVERIATQRGPTGTREGRA